MLFVRERETILVVVSKKSRVLEIQRPKKKSQVGERCPLIVSPLITTLYWPTHSRARFAWQHWLEFGRHYSVYYRVIVMATALSASWEDSGYHQADERDVCYGLISNALLYLYGCRMALHWRDRYSHGSVYVQYSCGYIWTHMTVPECEYTVSICTDNVFWADKQVFCSIITIPSQSFSPD